jgi:hypothetical protein
MAPDLLCDLLGLLDVGGAAITRLEAGGDWALCFTPRHFLKFNAVIRGDCWLTLEGRDPCL